MANDGYPDSITGSGQIKDALEAVRRGYTPIPIRTKAKAPNLPAWTRVTWKDSSEQEVREQFEEWAEQGMTNLGLLLGEASGGLVDVDLDHHHAMRLKNYFLPPTTMRTGRECRANRHDCNMLKEAGWIHFDVDAQHEKPHSDSPIDPSLGRALHLGR